MGHSEKNPWPTISEELDQPATRKLLNQIIGHSWRSFFFIIKEYRIRPILKGAMVEFPLRIGLLIFIGYRIGKSVMRE